MIKITHKVKLFLRRLLSFLPTPLPVGMTAFNAWSKDIIELSGLPDNDSMRWTVATMILETERAAAYRPKDFYIRAIRKAAANEIAASVMHELKEKQAAERKAAAEKAAQNESPKPIQQ